MIKPKTFRKLPECDTCLFYTGDMMLPCKVHPRGVTTSHCLDYREDVAAAVNWQQFLGEPSPDDDLFSDPGPGQSGETPNSEFDRD